MAAFPGGIVQLNPRRVCAPGSLSGAEPPTDDTWQPAMRSGITIKRQEAYARQTKAKFVGAAMGVAVGVLLPAIYGHSKLGSIVLPLLLGSVVGVVVGMACFALWRPPISGGVLFFTAIIGYGLWMAAGSPWNFASLSYLMSCLSGTVFGAQLHYLGHKAKSEK